MYEYVSRSGEVSSSSAGCSVVEQDSVGRVLDIPLPNGTLLPGSTIVVPMWIRGASVGGVHEVDFMFYYEPVESSAKTRYGLKSV